MKQRKEAILCLWPDDGVEPGVIVVEEVFNGSAGVFRGAINVRTSSS